MNWEDFAAGYVMSKSGCCLIPIIIMGIAFSFILYGISLLI